MIVVFKRNISWGTEHYWYVQQQFKFCVFRKRMILPKQEDGSFLKKEDFSFSKVYNCRNGFVVLTDFFVYLFTFWQG